MTKMKINKLANTMKSCFFYISKSTISGVAITTPDFPPNGTNLAKISPKVLETDSLPGITRTGPLINCPMGLYDFY
jgi:hypothetical protein